MPCDASGREYSETDDVFVDVPEELIGEDFHFKFKIENCRGLPKKYAVSFQKKFLILL